MIKMVRGDNGIYLRVFDCTGTTEACEQEKCESCCEHDLEEGICLDCGQDFREELSARAYDYWKGLRYDD